MNPKLPVTDPNLNRLHEDFMDSLDEELEMELDDLRGPDAMTDQTRGSRLSYFKHLLHLQAELVKLQDWVVANKQRVVILFEGQIGRAHV